MKIFLQLLNSGVIALSMRGANGVAGLLVAVCVSRICSPSDAGRFFLLLAVIVVIAGCGRLGFDQVIVKLAAAARVNGRPEQVAGLYIFALTRISLASAFFAVVLYFLADKIAMFCFLDHSLAEGLRCLAPAILGYALMWFHSSFFQSQERFVLQQLFQNLSVSIVFLPVLAILGDQEIALPQICMAYTFSTFACAFLSGLAWYPSLSSYRKVAAKPDVHSWPRLLAPFFFVFLFHQLVLWAPQIILGIVSAPHEVARFVSSARIANLNTLFVASLVSVVLPKLAITSAAGIPGQATRLAISTSKLLYAFSIPICVSLVLLPSVWLSIFDSGFQSTVCLQLLATAQLSIAGSSVVAAFMAMSNGERSLMYIQGLVVLVLMIATAVMGYYWGCVGAALAQVLVLTLKLALLLLVCTVQGRSRGRNDQ